jgi:hypothetical protein
MYLTVTKETADRFGLFFSAIALTIVLQVVFAAKMMQKNPRNRFVAGIDI